MKNVIKACQVSLDLTVLIAVLLEHLHAFLCTCRFPVMLFWSTVGKMWGRCKLWCTGFVQEQTRSSNYTVCLFRILLLNYYILDLQ
jgi:hypothetical protein